MRPSLLLPVAAAFACSCGSDPQAVNKRVRLQAFSGPNACADLEKYIEDTAVQQMRNDLEAARDGTPNWNWWGGLDRGGVQMTGAAGAEAGAQSAPRDYTQTNNQVAGVDEADFVKNDGTRIFVLSGNKLYATKSWPASQTSVQGKLEIEGWPREMFLDGNRVVVFSSVHEEHALDTLPVRCSRFACGYSYSNTVKVTVVDVSTMTNPRVVSEYLLPGSYVSGRMVSGSVRLVMNESFNYPPGYQYSPTWRPEFQSDAWRRREAYDAAIRENEALIRSQTLGEWLRPATLKQGGQTVSMPFDCTQMSKVGASSRLGFMSVVTLDPATPSLLNRSSIVAEPGEVYSSASNLYLATRHWWWAPRAGQRDTTYIHKFDITSPSAAVYVASGVVDGHIVDQFSLDESASGFLRVATTIRERVPDLNPFNSWGRVETTNRVSVLGETAGFLEVVGQSPDLAKGERVMSSRFVGDKGFVVTFRQVDPLFTFDLSNPRNPRVVGELKVPGFSTYMHPIDDNHLLTIGTYIPEPVGGQTDWRARALQLAIFDVSDLAHPTQTHLQLVGTAYGWSEAQSEHKAFNYFPAKKLLAIPFADWSPTPVADYWSRFTSDLRVFSVDPNTGFSSRGAISMGDMYRVHQYSNWTYYWSPSVRRSVMADDFVYAISDSGIRAAHISDLATPLATASFDRYIDGP